MYLRRKSYKKMTVVPFIFYSNYQNWFSVFKKTAYLWGTKFFLTRFSTYAEGVAFCISFSFAL